MKTNRSNILKQIRVIKDQMERMENLVLDCSDEDVEENNNIDMKYFYNLQSEISLLHNKIDTI